MTMINNYNEFLNRVNELGFMALSNIFPGFPALSEETPKEIWHTGDYNTDPWCWKDRAAQEKQLAFGCILGGNKGFISAKMYPYFYALFQPRRSIEESWQEGLISPTLLELWNLFEERSLLSTDEIRKHMGVTKTTKTIVDNAIIELQRNYYITVSGSKRKLNKLGQPYGWAANVYDKVDNWVPTEWMMNLEDIKPNTARQKIIETGISISKDVSENDLMKIFSMQK